MKDDQERIRTAFERTAQALTLRPSMGQGTAITRARVQDGFTCTVEDGRWQLTADLSEKGGGQAAGPDPGVFGRAALASCLAISYIRWAAWLEVPLEGIEVEVQAGYDARGEYGVGDVSPGYAEVRYIVTIESEASEADIQRLLDEAEAHTTWLDMLRHPHNLRREVHLHKPTID